MITVALTATIDAEAVRVWRAIVEASERPLWDDRILGEIHLPKTSVRGLRPGRGARPDPHANAIRRTAWRFRLAGVPLVMVDEVYRQEERERLVGRISIGSLHFDQVITVHEERDPSGPHTRLGLKLVAGNSIAVISELVPRLDVQRIVIEYVDTTLRQVRKYCETDERPELARSALS